MSGAACSYDPSTLSSPQANWALATYAITNNGGSDAVSLPKHHTYTDIEGRAVSNPLTANGADAYMLLTSANGCL